LRAVIFANGVLDDLLQARANILEGDILIAADGGLKHIQGLGLIPDIIIGDFDSISVQELNRARSSGASIIQHPTRKDFTDLELAIQHAVSLGVKEIVVMGALGKRWDQTLANLLIATEENYAKVDITLLDGNQELRLLQPGQILVLNGQPGDIVSLIPLRGEAGGIITQGLEYPLNNETLYFGATRGVSNVLLGTKATITLRQGLLMVVLIHEKGKVDQ
jgi:thiamine pyrophosphokinase